MYLFICLLGEEEEIGGGTTKSKERKRGETKTKRGERKSRKRTETDGKENERTKETNGNRVRIFTILAIITL